jgi:hypothetical protein
MRHADHHQPNLHRCRGQRLGLESEMGDGYLYLHHHRHRRLHLASFTYHATAKPKVRCGIVATSVCRPIINPVPRFVEANRIWDPISKALICSVDASLNIWFLFIVRRMVKFYGLTKYELLLRFNARLIIVSVSFDVSPPRTTLVPDWCLDEILMSVSP